jgi:hypothetical protein
MPLPSEKSVFKIILLLITAFEISLFANYFELTIKGLASTTLFLGKPFDVEPSRLRRDGLFLPDPNRFLPSGGTSIEANQ